jgi:hypothetical protein
MGPVAARAQIAGGRPGRSPDARSASSSRIWTSSLVPAFRLPQIPGLPGVWRGAWSISWWRWLRPQSKKLSMS